MQPLGSSLIHTIPAPHQRLPCLEDTVLLFARYQPHISGCRVWKTPLFYSHDTSLTSAAAMFGRHCSFIHTIPASHQWLPCVEDSALSLIQGDMEPLLQSLTHSPVVKLPPPQSGSESYYETARKSEESPDAPAQKSARSQLVPLRGKACEARSHLMPLRRKSAQRRLVTWCPCAEKRAKAISHLVPLRGKARKGGESPDAPAQKAREGEESPDAPARTL